MQAKQKKNKCISHVYEVHSCQWILSNDNKQLNNSMLYFYIVIFPITVLFWLRILDSIKLYIILTFFSSILLYYSLLTKNLLISAKYL